MDEAERKYQGLLEKLRAGGSCAVAFSGGVDSSLLLYAAREALGERAAALTAVSPLSPRRELEQAAAFCDERGITQYRYAFDALRVEGLAENPPHRCYLCKRALFSALLALAREKGFALLADGSNADDAGSYRPGMAALRELGIVSPLRAAGLTKAEIRALSRARGLGTWDKPSCACLASRLPYGETVTAEKLGRIDRAEELLRTLGFRQLRVRVHGDLARIELESEALARLTEPETRRLVCEALLAEGFRYVTLDLAGFRSGSMDEALTKEQKEAYS